MSEKSGRNQRIFTIRNQMNPVLLTSTTGKKKKKNHISQNELEYPGRQPEEDERPRRIQGRHPVLGDAGKADPSISTS